MSAPASPDASGRMQTGRPYLVVFLLLAAWILFITVTHLGPHSPYTGGGAGRIANADAVTVYPVTRFFYDGTPPADFASAHNLKLPLHSFAVAVAASFVRSYVWANYVVNAAALLLLAWIAVRMGERAGVRPWPLLVSLATLFALPPVVGYVGQPMHYVVGMVVNFALVLAVASMSTGELRRPVVSGLVFALFAVNYDPYVFIAAFVLVLATVRLERRRDDVVFALTAASIPLVWHSFLATISGGAVSDDIRERFIYAVVAEWSTFFEAPLQRILMPFIVTHIGWHVAFHQVIAFIYWPVLVGGVVALWVGRPATMSEHGTRLAVFLVAVYVLEQLATAAFDWENNPRRALPVVVAFGLAYTWAVGRFFHTSRPWRAAFVGLLLLTSALAFADVAVGKNGLPFLYSGEAIRHQPKEALAAVESELKPVESVGATQAILAKHFPTASRRPTVAFLFAVIFTGGLWLALFWIAARADLLPSRAPAIAAVVMIASAIRFVV